MKEFRLLNADEIEVRVGHVSANNASKAMLLLYKDARCDMKILDETLGITGWQRTHEVINGQLFCNVSIYDHEKETWITKQDVGVESFSEAEKGRASDAFKRACFNVGIGRELYTAPQIWVTNPSPISNKKDWNYKKFRVSDIGYDKNRCINKLAIEIYDNYKWIEVFKYGQGRKTAQKKQAPKQAPKPHNQGISDSEMQKRDMVENMFHIAKQAGMELVKVQEKMVKDYGKTKSNDLTGDEISEITAWISQQSFI